MDRATAFGAGGSGRKRGGCSGGGLGEWCEGFGASLRFGEGACSVVSLDCRSQEECIRMKRKNCIRYQKLATRANEPAISSSALQ